MGNNREKDDDDTNEKGPDLHTLGTLYLSPLSRYVFDGGLILHL